MFSHSEVLEERDGWEGTELKELSATLDVHDCTTAMGSKDMEDDSWALGIFNMLTKELHDGLIHFRAEILGIFAWSAIRGDILLIREPTPGDGRGTFWLH